MLDFIMNHIDDLLEAAAYIIAGASVIVKLTPATWDDNIIVALTKFIALNKDKK